jgi:uncharacterized membrane protein YkgB
MTEENKTHRKTEKPDNQSIDLMKVQIYADRCHAKFTSLLSFVFGYFLTLIVLFYSVLYQNLGPSPVTTWEVGLISTMVSTFGFLAYILWDYSKDVKAISEMMETVEQGKRLPKLSEFSSRKRTKEKSNQPKS